MNHAPSAPRSAPRIKTYTAERARAQFAGLLAAVAAGCVVEITRHGKIVASVLSSAKLETLELMANPDAIRADKAGKAGKLKSRELPKSEAELSAAEIETAAQRVLRDIERDRKAGRLIPLSAKAVAARKDGQ